MTGLILSSIVISAIQSTTSPSQLSSTVNVTIVIAPQSGKLVKSFEIVTAPQLSVAIALFNHTLTKDSLLTDPHSSVIDEGQEMLGAVVSVIITSAIVVAVRPHSSIAVNITVVIPTVSQVGMIAVKLCVQVTSPQASVLSVAPPFEFNHSTISWD